MAQNFREQIVVDPKDLANGYYPHLPRVSEDDLYNVLDWFVSLGIPDDNGLWTAKGTDPVTNEVKYLPTEIQWTKEGADDLFLDAALVFNFPHVARVELLGYFGLPGTSITVLYPGPRKTVQFVEFNPIGTKWPEQGTDAFRPAPGDQSPYGTIFTNSYGERFVKEKRNFAFISYGVWFRQLPF